MLHLMRKDVGEAEALLGAAVQKSRDAGAPSPPTPPFGQAAATARFPVRY